VGLYLIATDEAGYGPKLGPLVIAGSVWSLPRFDAGSQDLTQCFRPLGEPLLVDGRRIQVDDSKRVYQPRKGLAALECMVGAGVRNCGIESNDFDEVLRHLAPKDHQTLRDIPWLGFSEIDATNHVTKASTEINDLSSATESETATQRAESISALRRFRQSEPSDAKQEKMLMEHWFSEELQLVSLGVRAVTAKEFNRLCDQGYNKSDLLSMLTIELIGDLASEIPVSKNVAVYCDRHGGRRYYAGVLQNRFHDGLVRVVRETKAESLYEITGDRSMEIRFSVKGDRFAPVAYSSLVAKYIRERLMERLNRYFQVRTAAPLKATAGYPVDADRFLVEIQQVLEAEKISHRDLVRER